MNNLLYLLIVFLGFILPFISCFILNKKYKILSLEHLVYSYILFLIVFIIFSKFFYILLNFDINNLKLFIGSNNITDTLKFIFSGYSFIGGYIGSIVICFIFSKIIKKKFMDLLVIYLPSLILMYGILKIGCFIKGCCGSYYDVPIQLIESIINLVVYFYILSNIKNFNKNKIIGISFIGFGLFRFLLSFIRIYSNLFSFVFVQIFCLFLIIVGINFLRLKNS